MQVCFSVARGSRPNQTHSDEVRKVPSMQRCAEPDCPFCGGNEELTPPAVHTVGEEDSWWVRASASSVPESACRDLRVIPNKFPVHTT